MLYIKNHSHDPYFNMALEEYVLTTLSEHDDCFMLWQNIPAVIVGRNQNALEEINSAYVEEHSIAVVRRLTGGGAVYHDLGNVNFTFVVRDAGKGFDFERFSRPVIAALYTLGVTARHGGRNDITIDGRKFSGNAEYRYKDRLMHHGTLLFNSDLSVLGQALQVKQSKIESKGVKSVRSRVTNISEHTPNDLPLDQFKTALVNAAAQESKGDLTPYELTPADIAAINELATAKYRTWEWNYGKAPEFNVQRVNRYPFGEVDVRLNVNWGVVTAAHIYGDFFTHATIQSLANHLLGVRYTRLDLSEALAAVDVTDYLPGITREGFVELLIQ